MPNIAPVIITMTDNMERTQKLIRSAQNFGWPIQILVEKDQYKGANYKFKSIMSVIPQLRDLGYTHIISVDAFDFIVSGTIQTFLGQLHSLNFPRLIIAAETNCYPDKGIEEFYPKSPTRWRYVNSPFILDITKPIPKGFDDIGDKDDQAHISEWWLRNGNQEGVILDTGCRFFQTLYGVHPQIFSKDLQNLETGTYPIFFHGNGNSDMSFIPVNESAKVLVGIPTPGYTRFSQFFDHITSLKLPPKTTINFTHSQSPAANRNIVIRKAIAEDYTHVFFIDDDVLVPPDALVRLLNHNVDVVTGLYLLRKWPHQPLLFDDTNEKNLSRWKFLNKGERGLIEVENAGLGCCLIKTNVFKTLSDPWITLGEIHPEQWCDDTMFFIKVRKAGIKIHADLDVMCGHAAQFTVWPARAEDGSWWTTVDTQGLKSLSAPQLSFEEFEKYVEEQQKQFS